jgi:hypothetical protein
MHSRSSLHGFATARRGPDALAAVVCFGLSLVSAAALATLLFVRHLHETPGGAGYWTDALGFRAGVDNIGLGTVVSVVLNWHLHWQHNLGVLGSLVVCVTGYAAARSYWAASNPS